jgi:hypothetical protein
MNELDAKIQRIIEEGKACEEVYNTNYITQALRNRFSRAQVRDQLNKLCNEGKVERVKLGSRCFYGTKETLKELLLN